MKPYVLAGMLLATGGVPTLSRLPTYEDMLLQAFDQGRTVVSYDNKGRGEVHAEEAQTGLRFSITGAVQTTRLSICNEKGCLEVRLDTSDDYVFGKRKHKEPVRRWHTMPGGLASEVHGMYRRAVRRHEQMLKKDPHYNIDADCGRQPIDF